MSTRNRDNPTDPQTVLLDESGSSRRVRKPTLVVIRGERLGTRLDLSGQQLVIGRGNSCDFRINERSVSREHCRVVAREGHFWVEDLGSTNCSFVNDQPIERCSLVDGDQLRVGKTVLKFLDAGNPDADFLAELHKHAVRDELTGLYNRRHAMSVLADEFARSQRVTGARLVLAILDIDWFKQINDQIGHLAGDAVLIQLAQVLSQALRAGDTLARIGGEEFALIMPDTSLVEAHQACDRLRQRIAEHVFLIENARRIDVTVSIGLAEAGDEINDHRKLLGEADRHLYEAKTGGRNSVRSRAA